MVAPQNPIVIGLPSFGRLAQLVRALPSHGRGHKFESCIAHHFAPIPHSMFLHENGWAVFLFRVGLAFRFLQKIYPYRLERLRWIPEVIRPIKPWEILSEAKGARPQRPPESLPFRREADHPGSVCPSVIAQREMPTISCARHLRLLLGPSKCLSRSPQVIKIRISHFRWGVCREVLSRNRVLFSVLR